MTKLVAGHAAFGMQLLAACDLDDLPGLIVEYTAPLTSRGSNPAVTSVVEFVDGAKTAAPFFVITGFGVAATRPDIGRLLANLRSKAIDLANGGSRFVFVVDCSLSLLTAHEGSTILTDARQIVVDRGHRNARATAVANRELRADVGPGADKVLVSTGLLAYEHGDDEKFHHALQRTVRSVARHLDADGALMVLGEIERSLDVGHADTTRRLAQTGADALWSLYAVLSASSPKQAQSLHRIVSEEANSSASAPPMAVDAFGNLWAIERMLRRVIVEDCSGRLVDPATLIGEGLAARVRERAARGQRHRQHEMVPSPVEWLTLDELIQTIDEHQFIGESRGRLRALLPELRTSLVPARNSIVHFRSVSSGACQRVAEWYPKIAACVRSTNGIRSADSIPTDPVTDDTERFV